MNTSHPNDSSTSFQSFNYSFTLGTLLEFPSRILARIRKIDESLAQDLQTSSLATASASDNEPVRGIHAEMSFQQDVLSLPGPLAFITSGYAVGLLLMALLLNRIQHIVAPPRRSFAYRVIRSRRSLYHAIYYSIFPIDLSSTVCRLTLRIPSLYLLFRSLSLLGVILLQVSGLFPSWRWNWLQMIALWADGHEMSDVCWQTFGAACTALGVTALTRGLEGSNLSNTSSFNLFGYAFLLHIYANPITHSHKGTPSRPDTHILITIILPLLQLTMLHFLEIKRRWSRQRLVPTTVCSMLTLIHFHIVLLTAPSSYPLLNYLSCVLESLLLLVTLITISLNALTQLLLAGAVTQPLFGHTRTLAPKWDEDFAVALLRLGTASLEATSVAGLGNEVGAVNVGQLYRPKKMSKAPNFQPEDDTIELRRLETVHVTTARLGKSKQHRIGFANEIKHVKASSTEGDWWIDGAWLRELTRFYLSLWAVAKGAWKLSIWMLWYRWRSGETVTLRLDGKPMDESGAMGPALTSASNADEDEDALYRRFLSGEAVSDDDEDYELPGASNVGSTSESTASSLLPSDAEDEVEGADPERTETLNLYTDLMGDTSSGSASLLLAHMTAPSPLTRRRYKSLVSSTPDRSLDGTGDAWLKFVAERRASTTQSVHLQNEDESMASMRCCVICTAEPREVICWPCRCLALCDDCRANLATRFAASKHTCPCCRRSVEGYSRIYIP